MFNNICLMALLLFTINVKAQFSKSHFEIETTISIEDSNSIILFHLYSKAVAYKAKVDRMYYWFSGKKVMITQGGYDKNLLHGSYKVRYKNKQIKTKGQFKKGLKTGEWTSWYENGVLAGKSIWRQGLKKGVETKYDSLGTVSETIHYKKGVVQLPAEPKINKVNEEKEKSTLKEAKKEKPTKEVKVEEDKEIAKEKKIKKAKPNKIKKADDKAKS